MRNVGALIVIGASRAVLAGKSYNMACVTNGVTERCTGGNKSLVTFPLQAAQNYY
jgi:hypothetical protein